MRRSFPFPLKTHSGLLLYTWECRTKGGARALRKRELYLPDLVTVGVFQLPKLLDSESSAFFPSLQWQKNMGEQKTPICFFFIFAKRTEDVDVLILHLRHADMLLLLRHADIQEIEMEKKKNREEDNKHNTRNHAKKNGKITRGHHGKIHQRALVSLQKLVDITVKQT